MRFDNLRLRGAAEMLGHAIVHVGRWQPTREWHDGSYCDSAIEAADAILRLAMWKVERELDKSRKAGVGK